LAITFIQATVDL